MKRPLVLLGRRVQAWRHVRHVSGPARVAAGPEEAVAVCLVRNGALHVEPFVRHHLALGVRHLFLLDNDSSDGTAALAAAFDRVTVLRTRLPFREYQHIFRRHLFDRYGRNGWCLILDIDERFDYPFSDRLPLSGFLAYLNRHGYSAAAAQMLDLFAEGPPEAWPADAATLQASCRWYDLTAVRSQVAAPRAKERSVNPSIPLLRGGVRQAAFGVDCLLTKHPLLFRERGARPLLTTAHFSTNARVADVSCVLLHYKYDRSFRDQCADAVARRNYVRDSDEYRAYLARLNEPTPLELKGATAQELTHVDALLESGFLTASAAYRAYVREQAQRPPEPLPNA